MKEATKREIRYEAIYKAALKVFAEYGFKKTTIEDIARELGVVKSALYFYVDNKRDLYNKAVAYGMRIWQNRVREAVTMETDPVKQFSVMAYKALVYLARDRYLRDILMHDPDLFPLHPSKDPYSEINRDSIGMLKDILNRGVASGAFRNIDVETVTPFLFSIYVLLIQKTYMFPEEDYPESMFKAGIDLIVGGLRADNA